MFYLLTKYAKSHQLVYVILLRLMREAVQRQVIIKYLVHLYQCLARHSHVS